MKRKILAALLATGLIAATFGFAGCDTIAPLGTNTGDTSQNTQGRSQTPGEGSAAVQGTAGLEYRLDSGTSYVVTGIGTATDTNIVIPSTHNGKPVIAIGYRAFKDCTSITGVTVPESVHAIQGNAFEGCTSLSDISLPDTLYGIGYWEGVGGDVFKDTAYYNDAKNWDNGVLYIGKYLMNIKSGVKLGEYQVRPGTIAVAAYASNCNDNYFTSLTIPDSVVSIGAQAFCHDINACSLTSIKLGNGLKNIGDNAFAGTLITSIEIPESVTLIGTGAFSGCEKLANVKLGNKVTDLDYVFSNCVALKQINYNGTVAQWNQVLTKGFDELDGLTIICTDGNA